MSYLNRSIAGLAGSLALTGVHQLVKKYVNDAPDLDAVGEEAVKNSLHAVDADASDEDQVYAAALGGNILSNAMLFSTLATTTNSSEIVSKTLGAGLLGAAGTLGLSHEVLGNENKATGTGKKKWLTTGYYLLGALVSISVYNMLENKSNARK